MVELPNFLKPGSIFDLLNFRISEFYNVSGSLVTRVCEGEFGVTREEWQFIAMLAHLGPLTPSVLARRTTVDRAQASRTLGALQRKQLIYRHAVAGDGRRALVGLSDSGQTLYHALFKRATQVHCAVLEGLTEQEVTLLAHCLAKMHQRALAVGDTNMVVAQANRRQGGSRPVWASQHQADK